MTEEGYRITIQKAPFPVTFEHENCSKYKVFWEQIFHDDIGRRYSRIKRICTYNSIEEMEADVAGFLCFIEYEEERLNAMTEKAEREGLKMRINEMQEFLENQTDRIGEYDEQLVRKMIEKITIYDDKITICENRINDDV